MIARIQGPQGISHLGDKETVPTGHTAKPEAIATARPGVEHALTGPTWGKRCGCVFNWWVLGVNQKG